MFSKREQKRAKLQHAIISYVMDRCQKTEFVKVHITAICKKAGISKVTFFKYFKTKEDILLYYKSVFTLKVAIAASKNKLQGLKGLNKIINLFTEEINKRPSMIRGVVHYLLDARPPFKPIPVKPAEKILFFPTVDFTTIDVFSLDQLTERFMLDAILEKSITKSADAALLASMFLSMIYGTIVVTRYKVVGPASQTFRSMMYRYVKLLK